MNPFHLSDEQLNAFPKTLAQSLPKKFAGAKSFADAVTADLTELSRLADPDVVTGRIQKLRVNLSHDLMIEKVLFNEGNRVLISGMRFKNLDLNFPFVSLKSNIRIVNREDLSWISSLVQREYHQSGAKGFTFWEAPGLFHGEIPIWSNVVAGTTDVVTPGKIAPSLDLRWQESVDFYPAYKTEYLQWENHHPTLSRFLKLENLEDLEEAAKRGRLLTCHDEAGWAGVIAADPIPLWGSPAICIFEIFLAERLRGQGLAKTLQACFLNRLSDTYPLVWGHIHNSNLPSLKTAMSLGRSIVQQEYFVELNRHC